MSVDKVIADTGTSLMMMPDEDFKAITDVSLKDMKCKKMKNSLTACMCTEAQHAKVGDITFDVNGDEFVIPRDEWFSRDAETGVCVAKITHHASDMWIAGLNFFNNYYTVFDYGQNRIGFAKSIHSGINDLTFLQWAHKSIVKFTHDVAKMLI